MPAEPFPPKLVCFAEFEADLQLGRLFKRGVKLKLREQSFQVLAALLDHPGQIVTREELRRRLWPDDVFVDFENNLNTAVGRLREALGDSAAHPRFIETLPKRGYRFIGDVSRMPSAGAQLPARKRRLAVLPFLNLSGDPAQEYFSDAMTDEIITLLANLAPEHLAVIARTTAMHYKGSRKDVARIGRELGVDYIVEGALHRTEEQVAVNVQLIQTGDQSHIFARKYQEKLRDIFHVQSSVAQDIGAHIPSIVNKARGYRVTSRPSENIAAYNEYIKGCYEMWKWTPESAAKAKHHFEAALACDPRFALACDGLANLYGYLGMWGFQPPDEMEPLRWFYGCRAFELDPMLAEPRTHVAYHPVKTHHGDAYSYNWLEAERDMACARDLNPNSPIIRVRHSTVLLMLGDIDQAAAELQCALGLDPLSAEVHFWLAWILFCGRQYEPALMYARKLVELEPEQHFAYMVLGHVYLGMRRFEESVAAQRKAAELSREFPLVLGWLGLAFGLGGYMKEARRVLQQLRMIGRERYVLPTSFAWVHIGLGEIDDAFKCMELAVCSNDEWIHPLKTYPFLDPFRADPRFHALMCKLNLQP